MVILITCQSYPVYVRYMRGVFPYFDASKGKDFEFLSLENANKARGLQTGSLCIDVDGTWNAMPEWFRRRFTRVGIIGEPGDLRFVPQFPRED